MPNHYFPGSEWLYLKCYGGPQSLEEWALTRLYPLIRQWREEQMFRLFHFVRFLDPDYHLRIRFFIPDVRHLATIVGEINRSMQEMVESERIWKMEICTYLPEIVRYGAGRMSLVEEVFDHDSEFWLSALHRMGAEAGNQTWKAVFVSVDRMLDSFGASIVFRRDLMESLRSSFAAEFGLDRSLKRRMDAKYRNDQPEIEQLIIRGFPLLDEALAIRSRNLAEPLERLVQTFSDQVSFLRSKLPGDLIHMSLNRGFRTRHRFQELVVYDFLWRHYQSRLARGGES
ncbi:MAG: thiopeptide-type bacteriocin biosynthesis protein [Bacteroidales bacterium]